MEMQACAQQYTTTDVNSKTSYYNQGFIQSKTGVGRNAPRQMKVLFSGCGKAEKNMGVAAIPPLCPFDLELPYN